MWCIDGCVSGVVVATIDSPVSTVGTVAVNDALLHRNFLITIGIGGTMGQRTAIWTFAA